MPPITPHPSRSAPKCVDCRHYRSANERHPKCAHPLTPVALDDGREVVQAWHCRDTDAQCGPSGTWFEPKA